MIENENVTENMSVNYLEMIEQIRLMLIVWTFDGMENVLESRQRAETLPGSMLMVRMAGEETVLERKA